MTYPFLASSGVDLEWKQKVNCRHFEKEKNSQCKISDSESND